MNRSLQLVLVLCVASLVPGRARTDATTTVLCKDGTTAMGGRGACHGHGGVDKTGGSAPKAAEPSPSAEQEANTGGPVTCKDGSSWPKSGRGACRGHGGVLKPGATATAPAAPRAAAPPPATPRAAAPAPPATHPSAPVAHSNPTAGPAVAQTKSKQRVDAIQRRHRPVQGRHVLARHEAQRLVLAARRCRGVAAGAVVARARNA